MQRLFFAFPGGLPGLGLLLLRIALGATALYEGQLVLLRPGVPVSAAWLLGSMGVIAIASVLVGFLTPICCTALALEFLGTLCLPSSGFDGSLAAKLLSLHLLVLAFSTGALGPGAFSLDAHLFGRREIIFPR